MPGPVCQVSNIELAMIITLLVDSIWLIFLNLAFPELWFFAIACRL